MSRIREAFDLRSAIYAALLMGSIVWYINAAHGPLLATTAALKQAGYTFLMGGLIMRFCEWLALRRGSAGLALASAIIFPCIVTIGATFFVHSLRGTPEPVASTIPVAVISLPTFTGWALKSRKGATSVPDQGVPTESPTSL
ncbi:MAG: hypothetical protein GY733_03620 [bacterium]|nr:hypothetical protein [bacterium]